MGTGSPTRLTFGVAVALLAIAGIAFAWWVHSAPPVLPAAGTLRGANILLVTIDTLRADRLGAYGASHPTPALDGLATAGARFARAYTHAVMTLPAHASLLTGLVPPRHGVRTNGISRLPLEIDTVPERLRDAGYRTGAFIGAFVLDRRFGLDQGFETYDDSLQGRDVLDFRVAERPAATVLAAALDWLRLSDSRPWFAWVHLFDPHTPYAAPARSGSAYTDEVLAVDAELGRFLDVLRAERRLERTLVVVTADHGESLGEHGEATHGLFAYDATLRVPLIIVGAGVRAATVDQPVSHVEVAATLLSLVGARAEGLDGDPLQSVLEAPGDDRRGIYFEAMDAHLTRGWAPLAGVVREDWKYVDLPLAELYQLSADPAESRNLVTSDAERAARLARETAEWQRGGTAAIERAAVDADAAARLRSLGYTGGAARSTRATFTAADDPKTLLPLHEQFMDALERGGRGETSDAIAQLRAIIGERRDFASGYMALAALLIGSGDPAEAVRVLEQARAHGVVSPEVDERLGTAHLASGEPQRAVPVLRRAVEQSPDNVDAWNALAVASMQMGRSQDARQALRRALDAAPSAAGIWTNLGLLELRTGRRTDAAAAFRRATDLDPQAVDAWRGLGAATLSATDSATAVQSWTRAVTIEPADTATLFNLGVLLAEVAPTDAPPYLERFLRLPGTDAADRAHIEALLAQIRRTQKTPGAAAGSRR
jgi:arylsulfatase A-like enzyme/Flp pilus assembly protein TadD